MALADISISTGCRGVGTEVAFTNRQGVDRVELMDAELISKMIGDVVSNVVDDFGDIALNAVNGGRGAGASSSEEAPKTITQTVVGRRCLFWVVVLLEDEILSQGGCVELFS